MLVDGVRLLEGSSITNLTVASGISFPVQATAGEFFYRTDLDAMHVYNGTGWDVVQTGEAQNTSEQVLKGNFTGTVLSQTGTSRYYLPSPVTITKVYASLGTAGGSITEVDVKINGSSIFSGTRPTVPAGQFVGTPILLSTAASAGSYITVDVLSGAGADLIVYVVYTAN